MKRRQYRKPLFSTNYQQTIIYQSPCDINTTNHQHSSINRPEVFESCEYRDTRNGMVFSHCFNGGLFSLHHHSC